MNRRSEAIWLAVSGLVLCLLSGPAIAADRLVAVGGADQGDCAAAPCATLAYALGTIVSGDHVKVGGGTFLSNEDTAITQSSGTLVVTITGGWAADFATQDPMVVTTVTAGTSPGALGLLADSGASLTVNLAGLTFANTKNKSFTGPLWVQVSGAASGLTLNIDNVRFENNKNLGEGGAITGDVTDSSTAVVNISSCAFVKNASGFWGGAISLDASSAAGLDFTVTDSYFSKNKGGSGGGAISVGGASSVTVEDSTFTGNRSASNGGGAMLLAGDEVAIYRSTFFRNKARLGGGALWISAGSPVSAMVRDSVFARNSTREDGGGIKVNSVGGAVTLGLIHTSVAGNQAKVQGGGIAITRSSDSAPITAAISNSIVWANSAPDGPDIKLGGQGTMDVTISNSDTTPATGTLDGGGNLAQDPLFVDIGHGDLHLQAGSAMRDAGSCAFVEPLETDIDGDPRPSGPGCDIGADELTP